MMATVEHDAHPPTFLRKCSNPFKSDSFPRGAITGTCAEAGHPCQCNTNGPDTLPIQIIKL